MGSTFVVVNFLSLMLLVMSFLGKWHFSKKGITLAGEVKNLHRFFRFADYFALLIFLMFIVMMLLGWVVSAQLIPKPGLWVAYSFLVCILSATVVLGMMDEKIRETIKSHKTAIGLLVGVIGAGISYIAAPIADAVISEFTGLESSNFPRGQNIFILIVSVTFLWPLALSILGSCSLLLLMFRSDPKEKDGKKGPARDVGVRKVEWCRHVLFQMRRLGFFCGLILSTTGITHIVSDLIGSGFYSKTMRGILVSSSYHLPPQACGLEGQVPSDALVVQIRFRLASIAIPLGDGDYRFDQMPCAVRGWRPTAAAGES